MLSPLQTIRLACIAANPSILDLKFGCEFSFKNGVKNCVALSSDEWKRLHFWVLFPGLEPKYDSLPRKEIEKYIEILGRPIRLADVLVAIDKKGTDANLWVNVSGGFAWTSIGTDCREFETTWNLLSDDLRDQSPETLEFISNLLK